MEIKVYQTLTDRGNPDQIENDGPFACNKQNAWLGQGYYFWEYFIKNAHWWGEEVLKTDYVICQATYIRDEKCLDLVDNQNHLEFFQEIIKIMKEQGLYKAGETTMARIIEHLRRIKKFPFDATRINGNGSRSPQSKYHQSIIFTPNHHASLDLCPPIQICFYSKNVLHLSNYKIVYPEEYITGYGV